jgi:hypothetical protein
MTKTCSKCQKALPISEFHRSRSSGDGLYGWCKSCYLLAQRDSPASVLPKEKYCPNCKRTLPISMYALRDGGTGQPYAWCRECYTARSKYRASQIEQVGIRHCYKCDKDKEVTEFDKNKIGAYYAWCRECFVANARTAQDVPYRKCTKCGTDKQADAFDKNANGLYYAWCRECFSSDTSKVCQCCKHTKPLTEFVRNGTSHTAWCRSCLTSWHATKETDDSKECVQCCTVKPITEFGTNKDGALYAWCRKCYKTAYETTNERK